MAALGVGALATAICFVSSGAMKDDEGVGITDASKSAAPTLEETRVVMANWIETQRLISKERSEWQQGKDLLRGRLELLQKEATSLEEKIKQVEATVAETQAKRDAVIAENDRLKAVTAHLADAVSGMEVDVKRLFKTLPEPIQTKLQVLRQRIPEDPAMTKVTAGERYQNVLGILNEVNKANSELAVNFEVHKLADGKPSEVQVIYIGLAQAYYLSSGGEAGIGRPGPEGWTWVPSKAVANDVQTALEILQGKHTPAFVPLPVKLQ